MTLAEIYLALGESRFEQLLRSISIGKLKSYQMYERLRLRTHLSKLNTQTLRKAAPRLWQRLEEADQDLARDLGQSLLLGHFDLIVAVLDFLGIPHESGFFAPDLDPAPYMTEGWQARVYEEFRGKFPEELVLFYVNHLGWELKTASQAFVPVEAAANS